VPPSRLQPKLPRDLETICLKCLQKEPRKRYGSALDLAEDLRRFQAGEPIQARPAGALERAVKWARRRPAVAALSAAVVLVTVLGFAGVTAALIAVDQQRRIAQDSNAEMYRVNQQLITARVNLENANAATKKEAEGALRANSALQRSSYFTNVALAQQLWQGDSVARAREALERCPPEHRNWEWHYLKRQCRAELATYRGQPTTGERLAALSPDGRLLATTETEKYNTGRLRIREAVGGRLLHDLPLAENAHALVFHRDGKRLALALDGAVAVCDLGPRPNLRYLGEKRIRYRCVCWTPDGRLLAAGYAFPERQSPESDSGAVEVWDISAGKKLHTLSGFHAPEGVLIKARAMAFSADGKRLAAAAFDTGARFKKPKEPEKAGDKPARPPQPARQNPQPDAKNRAHPVPSLQGQIRIWDLDKGPRERILDGGVNGQSDLAFSPDGRLLAWGNAAAVAVLDLDGGQAARVLTGPQQDVYAVAFSPNGRRLAAGGEDTALHVWDVKTGTEEFALRGHPEPVLHAAFSGDGRRLASAAGLLMGLSGEVKVWDATDGPEARTARGPEGKVSVCTSLNAAAGRYVMFQADFVDAPVPEKLDVSVRRLADHHPLFRMECVADEALLLGLSADGARLASVRGEELRLLDAATGKLERTIPLPKQNRGDFMFLSRPVFSDDGRLLALAWMVGDERPPAPPKPGAPPPRKEFIVALWDADTGKALARRAVPVAVSPGTPSGVTGAVFRPDGKQLAVTVAVFGGAVGPELTLRGELHFFDTPTLRPAGHRAWPHTLFCGAYSHDGTLFAAGGGTLTEGRVVVCEPGTGAERSLLRGHTKDVMAVVFGPDVAGGGRGRLVTGGADGLIKLWDTASGQEVLTLRGHRRSVTVVAFSPDGRALYSATGLSLLDLAAMENAGTAFRLPMEVKTWDAPRNFIR
jgi:WD40 repeat protein